VKSVSTIFVAGLSMAGVLASQIAVNNQGYVPFSEEPIGYRSAVNDPVARLQKRLANGEAALNYEPAHGYLKSVLDQLVIPASSQTLVFSKTSFQYRKIAPQTPRALYFNDDVYVGQVHEGKVLEFVSFDPRQGAIFYILDEQKKEHPAFERAELDCIQCHVSAGTRNVPGVLLRSVVTTPSGTQASRTPSYITGHESPFAERWGGWYVTGTDGAPAHMGLPVTGIDTSAYLSPGSDVVSHLVLAHQTQMHNLITLTNYQTRIARYKNAPEQTWQKPAEELVRYLLFADEAPLTVHAVPGSSYATEFAARGPHDSKGRSLRDFDLKTRIFKYPCSYLIYSEAFDALPEPARSFVCHRLFEVLTGVDQTPVFSRLSMADRKDILEILLATKPGLPEEWSRYGLQSSTKTTTERKHL
jgi:hypothetical protein